MDEEITTFKGITYHLKIKGDIILSVRAPVGELGIAQFNACIGRGVCSIKGDKFIYYFLEMFKYQNGWKQLTQGSTFESISGNEIRNLLINYPNTVERNKIISFFSKFDQLIYLQSKKIEKLNQRKQAFLQKMFV